MKAIQVLFVVISLAMLMMFASAAFPYQATGRVLSVSDTSIVIEKDKVRWVFAREGSTKLIGGVEVGDVVTLQYRMNAVDIEIKRTPSNSQSLSVRAERPAIAATANELAQWIVDNADKRGSADFNIVAEAFQQARAAEQYAMLAPAPIPELPHIAYRDAPLSMLDRVINTGLKGTIGGIAVGILVGLIILSRWLLRKAKAPARNAAEIASAVGATAIDRLKQGASDFVEDTRECPFCKERVKARAVVCKHCHRDI